MRNLLVLAIALFSFLWFIGWYHFQNVPTGSESKVTVDLNSRQIREIPDHETMPVPSTSPAIPVSRIVDPETVFSESSEPSSQGTGSP